MNRGVALAEYLREIADDLEAGRAADGEKARGLQAIRGVVLNPPGSKSESLALINEIVGEALYGDFLGAIDRAEALCGR